MPFVAPAAYREIYGIELPPLSHIFAFNKTRRHTDFKPVCILFIHNSFLAGDVKAPSPAARGEGCELNIVFIFNRQLRMIKPMSY